MSVVVDSICLLRVQFMKNATPERCSYVCTVLRSVIHSGKATKMHRNQREREK